MEKLVKAPNFKLPDQNGDEHSLTDYSGKWILLYFYPRDDTPGCTKEACGIRDVFGDYAKANIVVLGVSADSVESHKKFEQKYELPFTLLSDEKKDVLNKYEVWKEKNSFGKKSMGIVRTSYLINPQGDIEKVYKKVKPELHATEVLEDVASLSKTNNSS